MTKISASGMFDLSPFESAEVGCSPCPAKILSRTPFCGVQRNFVFRKRNNPSDLALCVRPTSHQSFNFGHFACIHCVSTTGMCSQPSYSPSAAVACPPGASAATTTASKSNGTDRSIIASHPGVFTAESRVNGGIWTPLTCNHLATNDSFRRLIARLSSGEVDPRECITVGTSSYDIRLVAVPDISES